jgi:hypothetical protein
MGYDVNRRTLIGAAGIGVASFSLAGCATMGCDADGCAPPEPAPALRAQTIKTSGFVDAPITTSLAYAKTLSPDNAELSLIFDNFTVPLAPGASEACVTHGFFNFALAKKARGFKAALRGMAQVEAGAHATLHVSVGRTARFCRFPSRKMPNGEFLLEFAGAFDAGIETGRLPVFIALSGMNLAEKGDGLATVDSLDLALDVA